MSDLLDNFTPEERAKIMALEKARSWTHRDEISGMVEGMFDDLVHAPGVTKDMKGFSGTIFSRSATSHEDRCRVEARSEAKRIGAAWVPDYYSLRYTSSSEEEALRRFGVKGQADVEIRMFPDGNVSVGGRVSEGKDKPTLINFHSENIRAKSEAQRNTMSPSEAMALIEDVAGLYERYTGGK